MTASKFINSIINCYIIVILLFSLKLFAKEDEIVIENSSGFFINVHFYPASLLVSVIFASGFDDDDDN
jgi:hypothetical protein